MACLVDAADSPTPRQSAHHDGIRVLEAGQVLGLVSLSVDAVSADTQVQDGDGTWRSARGALTQPLLKRVGSAQAYSGRPDGSGRDSGKGTARSGKEGRLARSQETIRGMRQKKQHTKLQTATAP
eukprot:3789141-Rhodomonas_salina.2